MQPTHDRVSRRVLSSNLAKRAKALDKPLFGVEFL